jgi:RNA polymerase sigma factor (sigma-70 family)
MHQKSPLTSQEHAELVSYLARRTRDRCLAEDLAQDAMVRLLSFMQREDVSNPRALIYRIADNLMLNAVRQTRRRAEIMLVGDKQTDPLDLERNYLDREQLWIVQAAIDALPRKQRDVLIRRQLHGQSHRQIAEDLNLSLASVEKHIVRGIASIRTYSAKAARKGARAQ